MSGLYLCIVFFFFFFSSRRRHTRSLCDWSSDVCSSDLLRAVRRKPARREFRRRPHQRVRPDRKSTRLNSSHTVISYAVFCLKKKKKKQKDSYRNRNETTGRDSTGPNDIYMAQALRDSTR